MLYQQDLTDITALPSYVELPDAPFAMAGYRRGKEPQDKVSMPVYALKELVEAAIEDGVTDRVGAAIAHVEMLCRQQGHPLKQ